MELQNDLDNINRRTDLTEGEKSMFIEITKDLHSNDIVAANNAIFKARNFESYISGRLKKDDVKSYLADPQKMNFNGFLQPKEQISLRRARELCATPIPRAIISTRVDKICHYSKPSYDSNIDGFTVDIKGSFSKTKGEIKERERLIKFIENCGADDRKWDRDDFSVFLRKFATDSYSIDAACFEVVRDHRGRIVEFLAVDGSTIRFSETAFYRANNGESKKKGHYPKYVQIYNQQVTSEFYPWELCYWSRNISTDYEKFGYGTPEIQYVHNLAQAMVDADKHNYNAFTHGAMPKGMFVAKSITSIEQLKEFREKWSSQLAGVNNSLRVPVIEAEQFQYIDLQKTNVDMEYSKWQEYLIKTLCAMFKMDTSEIGFSMKDGKSLFNTSEFEKISHSYDKGLLPWLSGCSNCINKFIISEENPDYEFKFVTGHLEFDGGVRDGLNQDPDVKMGKTPEEAEDEKIAEKTKNKNGTKAEKKNIR